MGTGTPILRYESEFGTINAQLNTLCTFLGTQVILTYYKFAKGSHKDPFRTPSNLFSVYTVKKFFDIPVPRRDVTYQTLPGWE
jgi:hypothetical protein